MGWNPRPLGGGRPGVKTEGTATTELAAPSRCTPAKAWGSNCAGVHLLGAAECSTVPLK